MLSSEIGHRTTNTVIGSPIPVGTEPFGVAVTPDGSKVYVTNVRDNTVSVIDTTTNTVIGFPIPVGGNPVGAAVTPDGSRVRAYVTNASRQHGPASTSRWSTAPTPTWRRTMGLR